MPYDQQNPFARILRNELPSIRIYEDEHTVALMDIMPQAEGHVLVLPKEPAAEHGRYAAKGFHALWWAADP